MGSIGRFYKVLFLGYASIHIERFSREVSYLFAPLNYPTVVGCVGELSRVSKSLWGHLG